MQHPLPRNNLVFYGLKDAHGHAHGADTAEWMVKEVKKHLGQTDVITATFTLPSYSRPSCISPGTLPLSR